MTNRELGEVNQSIQRLENQIMALKASQQTLLAVTRGYLAYFQALNQDGHIGPIDIESDRKALIAIENGLRTIQPRRRPS